MVICGSYVHEFSVRKDMKNINNDKRRKEVTVRKVATHLCRNTNYQRTKNSGGALYIMFENHVRS